MKNFILTIFKLYFKILSALAPQYAGSKALKLFQRPQKLKKKKREQHFYDNWNNYSVEDENHNIPCYELGNPSNPTIVMVHGWESNAGSMSGIGMSLVQAGYHVVTFDGPGHGNSPLKYANLYVAGTALRAVLEDVKVRFNQTAPVSIVAHSFGSATTSFALSNKDLKVDKLIFLTSPNSISKIFMDFKNMIGLGDKAYQFLLDEAYEIVREDVSNIVIVQRLASVKYNQLTLIHDKHDKILPYRNAELMNRFLPNSNLIPFEHVGHYRMLWNPEVIKSVLGALNPKAKELLKKVKLDPFNAIKNGSVVTEDIIAA